MSYSISFPDIFNKSTINLEKDYDAVRQNIVLLLGSNKGPKNTNKTPSKGTKPHSNK